MSCPNCGLTLAPDAERCLACGWNIPIQQAAPEDREAEPVGSSSHHDESVDDSREDEIHEDEGREDETHATEPAWIEAGPPTQVQTPVVAETARSDEEAAVTAAPETPVVLAMPTETLAAQVEPLAVSAVVPSEPQPDSLPPDSRPPDGEQAQSAPHAQPGLAALPTQPLRPVRPRPAPSPYRPYPYGYAPQAPVPSMAPPFGATSRATTAPAAPSAMPAYPQHYAPYPFAAYPTYMTPRKPLSRDVYGLVVSWIVTVAGGLSFLGGLLIGVIVLLTGDRQVWGSLNNLGQLATYCAAPTLGGGITAVAGLLGILRRPPARFTLPRGAVLLGLGVLALFGAVVIDNVNAAPGPALAVFPLVIIAFAVPAFAVLAFTARRLGFPTNRRHTWVSFFYGATLAALVAGILNTVFGFVVILLLNALGYHVSLAQALDPINPTANDFASYLAIILTGAVVAPLVEEGMKPLGAALLARRLRTPAAAFLLGMASGIGFAIIESVGGYVGQGQADWVAVAIERCTTPLLHGVGAGMGALGWYYLLNGKGVSRRWLRGAGCLVYAVLQHGIYNGVIAFGLPLLPAPVGPFFQNYFSLGILPIGYAVAPTAVYAALILAWLVFISGRLRRSEPSRVAPAALEQAPEQDLSGVRPIPQVVAGGVG